MQSGPIVKAAWKGRERERETDINIPGRKCPLTAGP